MSTNAFVDRPSARRSRRRRLRRHGASLIRSARLRSPRLLALLILFFCSGACSLTYLVFWQRQLSLVFGVTVYAACTVLAAFMTVLAMGSLLTGRLVARISRPLVAFAIAEIGIGLSALATPV